MTHSTPYPRRRPGARGILVARVLTLAGMTHSLTAAAVDRPWINEFHYDDAGTDAGEFIEVAVPAAFAELSTLRVTLYNGGDGKPYGTTHSLSSFTEGESAGGLTFYSKLISGLQNGGPDGLALDHDGTLLQFISYEGVFTAATGPAAGQTSLDVLLAEGESTPVGWSLGMVGHPDQFLWAAVEESPGRVNLGQAMLVPEPGPATLLFTFGGLALLRRCTRRTGATTGSTGTATRPPRQP